jgi:hypothetical protein
MTGLALALAGCGGGGGGGLVITPTPTPTPTQRNTTLTNLQFSESFANRGATLSGSAAAGTGATSSIQGGNSTVTISYDAANQSYTVAANGRQATFLPADRTSSTGAQLTTYEKQTQSGGTTYNNSFGLYRTGQTSGGLNLTYASYGGWQQTNNTGTGIDFRQVYFVYGVPTAASDLPRTGSASYTTIVDGFWADPVGLYSVSGTSSLTANFAAGTVATNISLTGQNISPGGGTRAFGTLNGTQTISTSDASFSGALAGAGYSGTLNGLFFGPQAAEVGGAFSVTSAGGGALSGVIIGKKN